MAKSKVKNNPIVNRRAKFDYDLGDELVVGMVLKGAEVRSARDGHIQLKGSYVNIRDGELWLNNASFSLKINEKGEAGSRSVDNSPRKLLANRSQIDKLYESKKIGMSIVPLKLINSGKYIKLVIAIGRGKKRYDKRETLKRRDQEREVNRTMKNIL